MQPSKARIVKHTYTYGKCAKIKFVEAQSLDVETI